MFMGEICDFVEQMPRIKIILMKRTMILDRNKTKSPLMGLKMAAGNWL